MHTPKSSPSKSAIERESPKSPTSNALRSFDCVLTLNNLNLAFENAIEKNDYQELDYIIKVMQNSNIGYILDSDVNNNNAEPQNFLVEKLHLNLENNRDKHVYDFLIELKSPSIKDMVLMVLAAHNKLAECYQNFLFYKENFGVLPTVVAGNTYIEILLKKLNQDCVLLENLKAQTSGIIELMDKRLYNILQYSKPVIDVCSSEKFIHSDEQDKTLAGIGSLFKQQHTQNDHSFLEGINPLFVEQPDIRHTVSRKPSKPIIPIIAVSTILALLVLLDVISITLAAVTFPIVLLVGLYSSFHPNENL